MRKILTFMLGICLIIPCTFAMTACKDKKDPKMDVWDGTTIEVSAEENGVIMIETAEEFAGFAKAVNNGNSFEGKTIKLDCDLDMAEKTWVPIGLGHRSNIGEASMFKGIFDGNGKKIIGLSCEGYVPAEENKKVEGDFISSTVYTYNYGLFGMTENATIKNLTIKVDFDCDEDFLKGDSVGGIVGFANKGLTIENCVVNGEIEGYDAIGGVVGRAYNSNQDNQIIIKNCVNNAEVDGLFKAAGVLGYISSADFNAVIDNCVNNGEISVEGVIRSGASKISMVSGILTYGWTTSNNKLVITNNINKGIINACEDLHLTLPNIHAYSYIATSAYNAFDDAKHLYNFESNSNNGRMYYLDKEVSDSLLITLSPAYPAYSSSLEANNTTNI